MEYILTTRTLFTIVSCVVCEVTTEEHNDNDADYKATNNNITDQILHLHVRHKWDGTEAT